MRIARTVRSRRNSRRGRPHGGVAGFARIQLNATGGWGKAQRCPRPWALGQRMAQPIPHGSAGHLVRHVREIVWVTQSQDDVGGKHGSSCDSVTPAFFRKRVLKWRRLLRKKRRGRPRPVQSALFNVHGLTPVTNLFLPSATRPRQL